METTPLRPLLHWSFFGNAALEGANRRPENVPLRVFCEEVKEDGNATVATVADAIAAEEEGFAAILCENWKGRGIGLG